MALRPIVITHNQHMINGQSHTKMTSPNSPKQCNHPWSTHNVSTNMTWPNNLKQCNHPWSTHDKWAVLYKDDMAQWPIVITHNQHMINVQSRTKMAWPNGLKQCSYWSMINGQSRTKMTWPNGLKRCYHPWSIHDKWAVPYKDGIA